MFWAFSLKKILFFKENQASLLKFALVNFMALKNVSDMALLFPNYANPPLKCDVVTRAPLR